MELRNPLRRWTKAEQLARRNGSDRNNDPDPAEPDRYAEDAENEAVEPPVDLRA